jgi:hypothetical protein
MSHQLPKSLKIIPSLLASTCSFCREGLCKKLLEFKTIWADFT